MSVNLHLDEHISEVLNLPRKIGDHILVLTGIFSEAMF